MSGRSLPPVCWPSPTARSSTSCAGTASASRSWKGSRPDATSSSSGRARPGPWRPSAPPATPWPWSRRTAVFWTETGSAAEAVPAGLPRKALAPRSVLPYLRTRPASAPAAAATAAPDPFVETIVSLVSGADLASTVQTLQDFQTRYASTTNCEAAGESLFSSFTALGLDDVRFDPFTFSTLLYFAQCRRREDGRDLPRRCLYHLLALRLDLALRVAADPGPRGRRQRLRHGRCPRGGPGPGPIRSRLHRSASSPFRRRNGDFGEAGPMRLRPGRLESTFSASSTWT